MDYNYARFRIANYDYEKFPGPKAGHKMQDFTLHTLEGKEVKLSDYAGRWLVVETGSLTCPMFVKNIRPIDKLTEKYPDVAFVVVYVREAHPGSRRGAHADLEEKTAFAEEMKSEFKENREVLIDTVDGDMHQAYGSFPNMVYIIDPEGTVVYRCDWSFAKKIDAVLQNRPEINDQERVVIITAAPWIMIPVTLKGGWDALWDLIIELPGVIIGHLKVDIARLLGRSPKEEEES
ncbi:MAG: deiodinase-like protein [Hyphomonadaceae bacterium]